jgi:hypothetical protein
MKRLLFFLVFITSCPAVFGQESTITGLKDWLEERNFSIQKTFDGSRNENKPASIAFQENHRSANDFFNIDLGVKLSELELLKNTGSPLLLYPKVEWHKSTDSTDLKNKIDGGLNVEFMPFGLKSPDLPGGIPNKGLILAPWIQGSSSVRRNFIDDVFELKLAAQVSLVSNYKFLPGYIFRDKEKNFLARYYPYIGFEYYRLPGLITKGQTEEFSTFFVRLFVDIWIVPRTVQFNLDGAYRRIINNNTSIRTWLPLMASSVYFYPGKQEVISIGYEYTHGYDTYSKFQLIQLSSLKLSVKI